MQFLLIFAHINSIMSKQEKIMNFRDKYQTLDKKDFALALNNIKSSPDTEHFLINTKTPYFFHYNKEILSILLELESISKEIDNLLNLFDPFYRSKIIDEILLMEIESTARIENIISYNDDIFSVIRGVKNIKDNNIQDAAHAYKNLLETKSIEIKELSDIKNLFNTLLRRCIDEDDKPDGKYFRRGTVQIYENNESVYQGFRGESLINEGMKEFIRVYNLDMPTWLKHIIGHYIFETVHPFYDGTGRFGRFLFTAGVYKETQNISSFLISSALARNKREYFDSLRNGRDPREYGCLNNYVETTSKLLIQEFKSYRDNLKANLFSINQIISYDGLTKTEQEVYRIIKKATIVSYYGVSNEEIMSLTKVSKRALILALNKFKAMDLIIDTVIGKTLYHRISD